MDEPIKIHITKACNRWDYVAITSKSDFFANNLRITVMHDRLILDAFGEKSIYETRKPHRAASGWYRLGVKMDWETGDYFSDEQESCPGTAVFLKSGTPK